MTIAVLLLAACSAPNVVFLSVDTMRADHLGCYGYASPTSPHIDAFAKNALVFEDCVCEVPLTAPSLGSMMTSRLPRTTGTTRNGLRMPSDVPTIAEIFRAAGYHTFCVQSNWTLKAELFGIDRGFDVYDDDFHEKRWGFVKPERYAEEVTDVAIGLVERHDPAKPFFCWIHYSDPHAPYRLHRAFMPSGKPHFWQHNRRKVVAKYDSEVAYTDDQIGRLLDALPRENTVILFTADHGESLYEHDYLGHGRRIYQPEMHIPLAIAGAGIAPGRNTLPARGLDVGPTLLSFAGLEPVPGMLGKNLLADTIASSRARVVETYGGAVPKLPGAKALMAEQPPQRRGAIVDGWKLILDEQSRAELYRLPGDPLETNDLAADEPHRVEELRALIEAWDQKHPRGKADEASLTTDDVNALESLGYLE